MASAECTDSNTSEREELHSAESGVQDSFFSPSRDPRFRLHAPNQPSLCAWMRVCARVCACKCARGREEARGGRMLGGFSPTRGEHAYSLTVRNLIRRALACTCLGVCVAHEYRQRERDT